MPVIPALILAAGESRRMGGRPKALLWLPHDDNTFLGRIVDTLRSASLEEIVVVTGAHHEEIAAEVHRRRLPCFWSRTAATRRGSCRRFSPGSPPWNGRRCRR
jgi:CTP:molybdopterin cytidylyltransferase MocA